MGAPKKQLFPLLLILSLSVLFIYTSYTHSSLSTTTKYPQITLPFTTTPTPTTPNFTLIIKVLTFNRLSSLTRCLHSLSSANYLSDTVHLHIYIDHIPINNLNDTQIEIIDFVDGFDWNFGNKFVHYRTGNVGLQAQWLEAWWPSNDHEFAFVVEDDLEVSPLFYKFLKALIVSYYFNQDNFSPFVYGASLQRPRFVPGKHGNKINLDADTRLFLYQLVGTWGQLLFPKPWKEFRLWYDKNKAMGTKPIIDGMVTTGWYKKLGEKIWTPWFIKFIHSRGYYNFYTNYQHERALSVSHRDAGVNYGKTADRFFENTGTYRSVKYHNHDERFLKESLVKAYMVRKCLDLGYNSFIVDANILFIDDYLVFPSQDPAHDFVASKSLDLLFVRNSPSAKKIWTDDFLNMAVQKSKFVPTVMKLLEQSSAKMGWFDEISLGINIYTTPANQSSLADGKKIVYWSSDMGLDLIQNRLNHLNLWAVDGDLSCKAVVCHQS
ncbi:hypothetical protein ACFE04_026900 [Oxalis oulophora]